MRRCKAITKKGNRCKNKVVKPENTPDNRVTNYCDIHYQTSSGLTLRFQNQLRKIKATFSNRQWWERD